MICYGCILSAPQEGNTEVKHAEGQEAGQGCPARVGLYKHTRVSLALSLHNLLRVDSSRSIFVNMAELLSDMLLLLPTTAPKPHAAGLTFKPLFLYGRLGTPERAAAHK